MPRLLTPLEAEAIVDRISNLFGLPPPAVKYECAECFKNHPEVIACHMTDVVPDTICFRSDYIPDVTPAHEMGHWYANKIGAHELEEAFAQQWEVIWQLNGFNFGVCEICGNTSPWSMDRLGDLICENCHTAYGVARW